MNALGSLQLAIDRLEELENIKQISDVEKIADNEREMNAIEKISKLEKALDKACDTLVKFMPSALSQAKEQWKEYLLSEVSND